MPFQVLYPSLQTAPASSSRRARTTCATRASACATPTSPCGSENTLGGYYDFEGTDWLNPPLIAHPNEQRKIGARTYMIFADGSHIHVIAWRRGTMLYWLTNTLLEDLSNEQMLAIARSAKPLH